MPLFEDVRRYLLLMKGDELLQRLFGYQRFVLQPGSGRPIPHQSWRLHWATTLHLFAALVAFVGLGLTPMSIANPEMSMLLSAVAALNLCVILLKRGLFQARKRELVAAISDYETMLTRCADRIGSLAKPDGTAAN